MKFLIYGFENMFNHKIYVGQTCRTLKERIQQHKNAKSLIGRAIRKYGLESFFIVILAECESKEEANELEIYLIKTLNCKAPNGYNCTDGGEGGSGHNISSEGRKKVSLANSNRKQSEETRKKISDALKARNKKIREQKNLENQNKS